MAYLYLSLVSMHLPGWLDATCQTLGHHEQSACCLSPVDLLQRKQWRMYAYWIRAFFLDIHPKSVQSCFVSILWFRRFLRVFVGDSLTILNLINPSTYIINQLWSTMHVSIFKNLAKEPASIAFTTKLLMCALQWMPIPHSYESHGHISIDILMDWLGQSKFKKRPLWEFNILENGWTYIKPIYSRFTCKHMVISM